MKRTRTPTLGATTLAALCIAGAVQAQAPPRPPNPEPNNVLRRNEDATYQAVRAAQAATLKAMTPVTEATLKAPADGDWLTWRRTPASLGHSPLEAINKANVKGLVGAWAYTLPVGGNEATPLVHDGVLFVASGPAVVAIDGASGDLLWQYNRVLPAALNNGRGTIIKNIALYGDRLFSPTADGHMVALDARTGKLIWDHAVLDDAAQKARVSLDGGPLVARGKVIMGSSSCQTYPGGCFIFGLDAMTGEESWRFHTVAQPGTPGGDTWNGAPAEQRYGGAVWTSGSYDPDLGLVYFGIGNNYSTGTVLVPRPGVSDSSDSLFTETTVALEPETGRLAWHFQHVNREVWDLDWVFEQSLLTLPVKGKPEKLVFTGGKIALFDGVDRATGKYAFSVDAGIQTLITGIDPVTGKKTINPVLKPEPGVTKPLCPHSGGGRNWPATAIDPNTRILYLQLFETCQDFTWRQRTPEQIAAGGNDMTWVLKPMPNSDGKFGRVQAIDLTTGKTLWTYRQRTAFASSVLSTDGGLVFVGGRDRWFNAFDARTGARLWRARLPAAPSSTPVTYTAGGAQYVAVVAGAGGPQAWNTLTPENDAPGGGTTLMVFKQP